MENEFSANFSQVVLRAKLEDLKRKELYLRMEWERSIRLSIVNQWFLCALSESFLPIFDRASAMLREGKFDLSSLPFGDIFKLIENQKNQFAKSLNYSTAEGGLFLHIDLLNAGLRRSFSDLAVRSTHLSDDLHSEIEILTRSFGRIEAELSQFSESNSRAVRFLNQLSGQFQLPTSAFLGFAKMMGMDPDELKESSEMQLMSGSMTDIEGLRKRYEQFLEMESSEIPAQHILFDFDEWMTDLLSDYLNIAVEREIEVFHSISSVIPEKLFGNLTLLTQLSGFLLQAALESVEPASGNEGPRKFKFGVEAISKESVLWLSFRVFDLTNTGFLRFMNQLKGLGGKPAFLHSQVQPLILMIQSMVTKSGGEFFMVDEEGRGCSLSFSMPFSQA